MPYSNNLRLELITTGTQAGTWGDTTNTNLGTLLEGSIAGYDTVLVTSSSQALTANNGAADQSRLAIIRLTTTTGAAFTVYAPPVSKQYIVYNNSGQTATFSNATIANGTTATGGSTVTVNNGDKVIIFSDGTNFYSAGGGVTTFSAGTTGLTPSTASTGAVTLAGTLATANGGTGLTTFTAGNNALYSSSASALTAGTLPVAAGGTGQTTYTNGQLLIGNTTGNTLTKSTLTAGSGITITNGAGTITIASSAGGGTVTSVGMTVPAFLTVTGSPVTTTGTLAVSYSGTALPLANGGTGATTASTAATNLGLGTASAVQFGSLGVGTAGSATTGEIRATNNVTAYYSSDRKFKENVKDIENAAAKAKAIGGKTFDWTDEYIADHGGEDGYFVQKQDFGVIAQDVQAVFPMAVKQREDGSLAVDYQKLSALALAAIAELTARIEALENK